MSDLTEEEVQEYLSLFFDIDNNDTGTISRREMREFLEREGYEKRQAERIYNTFDLNKSGVITFQEWCGVLNLDHRNTKRREYDHEEDVTVLAADMDNSMQRKIITMYRNSMSKEKEMKDVAKNLKAELDRRFLRLWHVVIIKGQYWAYYSHEPKYSFVFRVGSEIVVIWRTPIL